MEKKGTSGLASHGPGQEGLARSRRADQQNALGNASAQAGEPLGVAQKLDDLDQLLLGLLHPGHVNKGLPLGRLVEKASLGLAEGHGLAPAHLHLAHEEDPDADEEDHGEPGDEHGHIPGRVVLGPGRYPDLLVPEHGQKLRVVRNVGGKTSGCPWSTPGDCCLWMVTASTSFCFSLYRKSL